MKIGVVVDASCDLPRSYIDEHRLIVLPNVLEFGEKEIIDSRDARETLAAYRRYVADKSLEARSRTLEVDAIRDLFLDDLVLRFDRVLVLCVSSNLGSVFSKATQASYAILQGYRQRRAEAGLVEPFALRVLDTGSVGPGEAVLAAEAIRMLEDERPPFEKARRTIRDLSRKITCLLVPNDLFYLRHRARGRGEDNLGPVAYRIGSALGIKPILEMRLGKSRISARSRGFESGVGSVLQRARTAISQGQARPIVAMSFGGDPRRVRELSAYQEFEAFAAVNRCDLHLSVMSATLALNVGPGAFSLAFIGD
jgi:DegV family protein with EDD domain